MIRPLSSPLSAMRIRKTILNVFKPICLWLFLLQVSTGNLYAQEVDRLPQARQAFGYFITSQGDSLREMMSEEMKAGICYSTDNQLPNLDDTGSVILTADSKVVSGGQLNVLHSLAAGTYYVRAFAQSEAGVGYSPVLRIVVE